MRLLNGDSNFDSIPYKSYVLSNHSNRIKKIIIFIIITLVISNGLIDNVLHLRMIIN